jgi:dihydropteroate synthase
MSQKCASATPFEQKALRGRGGVESRSSKMAENDARARLAADRDAILATITSGPAIMGIINATPDSFSDGGRYDKVDSAVAQARRLAAAGADILDIGAESTRPGHAPLSADDEWARLQEILPAVLAATQRPLSIDTYKAATARRATGLGVCLVNDVWGLQRDADMAHVVADSGAALCLMHNRESVAPACDIVSDILRFFEASLRLARQAGVPETRILLDPGIGFGKTLEQNLAALRATGRFKALGFPVLIGVSRKRMFGDLLGRPVDERLIGTLAANLATLAMGADVFRVHDVAEHADALKIWRAIHGA